ncbi:MAG: ThiF family adenylyltransferase [Mycobacterium sp.]|nr:ThiF family adenylyltransferase [Mycobacterium sp.]
MNVDEWVSQVARPRVKPELVTQRLVDGRIRIGGLTYTVGGEIEDPTGAVWTLVEGLDGTHTVEELTVHVRAAHPEVTSAEVRAGLCALVDAGYLDDADERKPTGLSQRDIQRYERGRRFFRWVDQYARNSWEPQLRLRDAAVTVVGMGGTGGSAALALACSGVGRLHCVDYDIIELSNLNRQILFTDGDIGRPKVDAAVKRLRSHNADITVTGQDLHITGQDDFSKLVSNCDALILAADTPGEIRSWANQACIATDTPWVDGGYHGPVPCATTYIPGHGPCYECTWRHHHERMRRSGTDSDYSPHRTAINAVVAPTAIISGQLLAHMVLALLTKSMPVTPGQYRGIDLLAPDHLIVIDSPRYPDCLACGEKR